MTAENTEDGAAAAAANCSKDQLLVPDEAASENLLEGKEEDEVDALPRKCYCTNMDLICTLISLATYIFDMFMDLVVAAYFYHLATQHGVYHYWYFGLTVTFILLPSLTMTGFSLRWYLLDQDNKDIPKVPIWKWIIRLIVLLLQIAPVLRYLDSFVLGLKNRYATRKANAAKDLLERRKWREEARKYFLLMVYEDSDATLLRLFEGFMESAPQLVLQLYILMKDPDAIWKEDKDYGLSRSDDAFIKTTIIVVSILSSLISLAWSLVVYHRSLRYTYEHKQNLGFAGSLLQFSWHLCSISARVLALSLFASVYPRFIGVVCTAHWLIMFVWVLVQNTGACNTKWQEVIFSFVLGAIYIFSFFNAKDEHTRYKYCGYYLFCFVENTVLVLVWFFASGGQTNSAEWYHWPGIIGHYVMFFFGLIFMTLYYGVFHPTGSKLHLLELMTKRNTVTKHSVANNQNEFIDLREMGEQRREEPQIVKKSADEVDRKLGFSVLVRRPLPRYDLKGHRKVVKTNSDPTAIKDPEQNANLEPRTARTMPSCLSERKS